MICEHGKKNDYKCQLSNGFLRCTEIMDRHTTVISALYINNGLILFIQNVRIGIYVYRTFLSR
jgi:hypothetical protein